jgi:hypothetical protein
MKNMDKKYAMETVGDEIPGGAPQVNPGAMPAPTQNSTAAKPVGKLATKKKKATMTLEKLKQLGAEARSKKPMRY